MSCHICFLQPDFIGVTVTGLPSMESQGHSKVRTVTVANSLILFERDVQLWLGVLPLTIPDVRGIWSADLRAQ